VRLKTWIVAALGLGCLVALLALSLVASSHRSQDIYARLSEINSRHRRVEANLRLLRSDVNLSGIYVRDYLLDVGGQRASEYQEQLTLFRHTNQATVTELQTLVADGARVNALAAALDQYWAAFDRVVSWTPTERFTHGGGFLLTELIPRREAVLAITRRLEDLNNSLLASESSALARGQAGFGEDMQRLIRRTVLLGLAVAVVVVLRLRVLEQRSEASEHRMRELSRRLVEAQEEERTRLSRELHDHVAQVLTALRMELGRIERISPAVRPAAAQARTFVDDMFLTVRNLALGLRPSMLDDFGLRAALEWHVRDFMQRYGIAVELTTDGPLQAIPERHRTCVYRIVQEAMTNAARHAHCQRIAISVIWTGGKLEVSVADDGVGLEAARRRMGLGLRGIEERVAELGGRAAIAGRPGQGTRLDVTLPLAVTQAEVPSARIAG
jgi:signal transduction histidine kinase